MLVLAEYGGKILKTKPQRLLGAQRGDIGASNISNLNLLRPF